MRLSPNARRAAFAFLASPQGQRMMKEAYRKFSTPENKAKVRRLAEQARLAASRRKSPSR